MPDFDSFVILAEMRTGSNFLEANINAFPGLHSFGEAFNPHFIGYPNSTDILGITQAARDANPQVLLDRIRDWPEGLGGFRLFSDHDPRVIEACLANPRCAKIVLTRNPLESFVSRKIAAATGQWKLTNVRHARQQAAHFDAAEFTAHLTAVQAAQVHILNTLQRSAQTAFYLDYEDLQDLGVMNGLARWLGCTAQAEGLDTKLKKQNPEPMAEKVANYPAMEAALARLDRFNLTRTPNFEPRRGPMVPGHVAAAVSPLIYLPVRCGPEAAVRRWLAALDDRPEADLQTGLTQKTLRLWLRDRPGHRSFTVLRHPLARAHAAFCELILPTGPGTFGAIRQTLRTTFKVPLPKDGPTEGYDAAAHRAAFMGFLAFVRANLSAQTALRTDPSWATQFAVIHGMAEVIMPDMILREERLQDDLAQLAAQIGDSPAPVPEETDPHAPWLAAIYDAEVEAAGRDAYLRDYVAFGFGDWRPPAT
ncbi:MAG: nodulation protein NodH [Limimaricola sp.]|uniref:nodulation protein NodH n=1 Tax=Limimaricola sp. TaxID=2211665 RepID=UPI001D71E28A|nr:nodulation protein NodH [Limimaricola sp.]MBI1417151.1 nodulation protein NodH [Limimaricola sp.]